MKKILVLLFILTAFQSYAFDVDNLNGADCMRTSDAEADGFDPDMWYTYQCTFSSSATMESIYKDVIQNIADEASKILSEADDFSQSYFDDKIKEFKNRKQDFSYTKRYNMNSFSIGVQFEKNNIIIQTNEGQGEESYSYIISKSSSDSSILLTYEYDSGF